MSLLRRRTRTGSFSSLWPSGPKLCTTGSKEEFRRSLVAIGPGVSTQHEYHDPHTRTTTWVVEGLNGSPDELQALEAGHADRVQFSLENGKLLAMFTESEPRRPSIKSEPPEYVDDDLAVTAAPHPPEAPQVGVAAAAPPPMGPAADHHATHSGSTSRLRRYAAANFGPTRPAEAGDGSRGNRTRRCPLRLLPGRWASRAGDGQAGSRKSHLVGLFVVWTVATLCGGAALWSTPPEEICDTFRATIAYSL